MLKLLELIPKKKSLYHALKELNLRNSNDILLWFAELNVSPITISKRQKGDFFKNPLNSSNRNISRHDRLITYDMTGGLCLAWIGVKDLKGLARISCKTVFAVELS